MPTYEFVCRKCGKVFEVYASIKEREGLVPACPKCKSKKVSQRFGRVAVITSSKGESEDFDLDGETPEFGSDDLSAEEDLVE